MLTKKSDSKKIPREKTLLQQGVLCELEPIQSASNEASTLHPTQGFQVTGALCTSASTLSKWQLRRSTSKTASASAISSMQSDAPFRRSSRHISSPQRITASSSAASEINVTAARLSYKVHWKAEKILIMWENFAWAYFKQREQGIYMM